MRRRPALVTARQQGMVLGFVFGCLVTTHVYLFYQSHVQPASWLRQQGTLQGELLLPFLASSASSHAAAIKKKIVFAKEEELVVAGICDAPNDSTVLEKPCRPRKITIPKNKEQRSTFTTTSDEEEIVLADAFPQAPNSQWTTVTLEEHPSILSFEMLVLDPRTDTYISKPILEGKGFDLRVLQVIADSIKRDATTRMRTTTKRALNKKSNRTPVMVDVGGNIGFFTLVSLALGARTFTFEPLRSNVGTMLRSIERNAGFRDRATVFHNAVHYVPSKVYMVSTNTEANLSNGFIKKSEPGKCGEERNESSSGVYGVDYMETVTLDQIFLQYLKPGEIVDVMKMDIESYEAVAINGGLRFLCRNIVRVIVMEVVFLNRNKMCSGEAMFELFKNLGYTAWTVPGPGKTSKNVTHIAWANMRQIDLSFRLENPDVSPMERMQGDPSSPCKHFE